MDFEAIDIFFFFSFAGSAALYLESEYTNDRYEKAASPFGGQMLCGAITPRVQILVWHLVSKAYYIPSPSWASVLPSVNAGWQYLLCCEPAVRVPCGNAL